MWHSCRYHDMNVAFMSFDGGGVCSRLVVDGTAGAGGAVGSREKASRASGTAARHDQRDPWPGTTSGPRPGRHGPTGGSARAEGAGRSAGAEGAGRSTRSEGPGRSAGSEGGEEVV